MQENSREQNADLIAANTILLKEIQKLKAELKYSGLLISSLNRVVARLREIEFMYKSCSK